jgi:hypothetical protein
MKRLSMMFVFASLLILLPLTSSARAASDDEAVRKLIDQYAETWNKQDVDGFVALFAPDTQMVILNAQVWKGREGIRDHLSFLFGTVPPESVKVALPPQAHGAFKTTTYRFDDVTMKFIHKDVAVAQVYWTQMGDPRFKDKPRTGVLTLVANRDGDKWIFSAFQNTARP